MSSDVTKLLGLSNLTSIPKDQQNLLGRHGAGVVHPKDQPVGLEDVPAHVLSTVKDAYVERRKRDANSARLTTEGRPQKSSKPNPGHIDARAGPNGVNHLATLELQSQADSQSSPPPNRSIAGSTTHNGDQNDARPSTPDVPANTSQPAPSSSPERFLSWTPSSHEDDSERPGPRHQLELQPEDVTTTPNKVATMPPPPKPATALRIAPSYDFPSSGPDEDLEVELPQARANTVYIPQSSIKTPNVRGTVAMETPPCAQPSQTVIPGTAASEPSPPLRQVAHERPRTNRMKPIRFSDPPAESHAAQPANASTSFQRMAPTKAYPQVTSSNTTTSSTIIPASLQHPATPGENETSSTQPRTSPVEVQVEANEDAEEEMAQHATVLAHRPSHQQEVEDNEESGMEMAEDTTRPEYRPSPEQEEDNPEARRPVGHRTRTRQILAPYDVFTAAYPSYTAKYSGSLSSFVKACLCLEHMCKHRALNHFLWDDFIRAFSAEYLGYVQHTTKPLVASEWYNDREEAPVFRDDIVHKNNLSFILNSYPLQVDKARQYITRDEEGSENPQRTSALRTNSVAPEIEDAEPPKPAKKRPTLERPPDNSRPRSFSSHLDVERRTTTGQKVREPKRYSSGAQSFDGIVDRTRIFSDRTLQSPRTQAGVRSSAPKPNPSITSPASASGYFRRLHRPRSAQEQEKFREHIRRRTSGAPTASRSMPGPD